MEDLGAGFTEELSFCRMIYYPAKKLLHTHLFTGVEIDKTMSLQSLEVALRLTNRDIYLSLVTMDGHVSLTSEARSIGSSDRSLERLVAQAIVVNGLPTRLLANFFIRFNKPQRPTQIFSNKQDAIAWLLNSL